jgi:hypothetical protein
MLLSRHTRRREALAVLAAIWWSLPAEAQQPHPMLGGGLGGVSLGGVPGAM